MSKNATNSLIDEISSSLNRGVDEFAKNLAHFLNKKLPIVLASFLGRFNKTEIPINRDMLIKKKTAVNPHELGYSINERRVIGFDEVNFSRHTFISGASGWGKSYLFKILIENNLKNERPLVYIDPKGANSEIQTFIHLCEKYGRKYYIFSEHYHSPSQFNPLGDLDCEQVVEGVIRSFVSDP